MQNPTTWTEIFSVIASIVSIILGGFAIGLSIMFYRFSNDASKQIKDSSEKIGASVERLEALFSSLYSDTFSMMRDTVSDMRKHIWHADTSLPGVTTDESEVRADQLIADVQREFQQEVGKLLSQQTSTDAQVAQLREEMKSLVSRAIEESRRVETKAREVTVTTRIRLALMHAQRQNRDVTAAQLAHQFRRSLTEHEVVDELFKMAREGVVTWEGAPLSLSSDSILTLVTKRGSAEQITRSASE